MLEYILLTALFFLAGWATSRMILPGILSIVVDAGYLRANFRGAQIPTSLGVVIFISCMAVLAVSIPFLTGSIQNRAVIFMLALSGYTCLGLMDDIWGCQRCKGLYGHIKSLFRGHLTTGSIKALAGGMLAVFIAAAGGSWPLIPLNALILALSVNMINLLDLRPGRAAKGFLLIVLLLPAADPHREELMFTALVAGSLLAYLPVDLRARAMMGDAGSNALGAVLGLNAVWLFDTGTKVIYLTALVILHLLAEKRSLTGIIAANRVLDYLDRLGRK